MKTASRPSPCIIGTPILRYTCTSAARSLFVACAYPPPTLATPNGDITSHHQHPVSAGSQRAQKGAGKVRARGDAAVASGSHVNAPLTLPDASCTRATVWQVPALLGLHEGMGACLGVPQPVERPASADVHQRPSKPTTAAPRAGRQLPASQDQAAWAGSVQQQAAALARVPPGAGQAPMVAPLARAAPPPGDMFQKAAVGQEVTQWLGRAAPADRERFERVLDALRCVHQRGLQRRGGRRAELPVGGAGCTRMSGMWWRPGRFAGSRWDLRRCMSALELWGARGLGANGGSLGGWARGRPRSGTAHMVLHCCAAACRCVSHYPPPLGKTGLIVCLFGVGAEA